MIETIRDTKDLRRAQYLCSAHVAHQWPQDMGHEVAFAGRSNVGKSSAINAIAGQARLARTSKTPGRTQQIVFFRDRFRATSGRFTGLWICQGATWITKALGEDSSALP